MTPPLIIGSSLHGDRANCNGSRLTEYDARPRGLGKPPSVFSAQNLPIPLERTHGECAGCHGDHDLVNGYCSACRTLGANDRQDLDTTQLQRRQEVGRRNNAASSWRKSSYKVQP